MPKKIQKNIPKQNLKKNFLNYFNKLLPFLIVIFVIFGFFWKVIFKSLVPISADIPLGVYYPWLDYKWGYSTGVPVKNPIMSDVVSFSYPMRNLVIDLWKQGQVPLWNPFILGGTPLLANFQSAPFSPTNFIYFLTDKLTAWSWQVIMQHLLAATFMYLLLRHWKIKKFGAILGGVIFAFSGFNLIWSQWNSHTLVASFIPLLILFSDRFLMSKKWIDGFALSLILLLQIISGYPQVVIYTLIALGIFGILNIRKNNFLRIIFLGIFILGGLSLAAFQILPTAELLSLSQRQVESYPFDWAFLPLSKIITFIAPDYFGNHATYNYWGLQDYTSNTGFVGIVGLILSFISLKLIRANREVLFGFILLVISLLFSFPTPVSIALWKSGILGFNAAAAHRALILFNFSVSLLVGFGLNYLIDNKIKYKQILLVTVPIFLLITIFSIYALSIDQFTGVKNLILPGIVLISTLFVLFISRKFKLILYLLLPLSIIELFYFGWKFTPFSPRELVFPLTPITSFLQSQKVPFRTTGNHVIPINLRMNYGIEAVEGYDAIYPASASNFINLVNNNEGIFRRYGIVDNDTSDLLDLANAKYFIALKSDPNLKRFDEKRFKIAFEDKSVLIYESNLTKDRAYFLNSENKVTYKKYSAMESILEVDNSKEDNLTVSDTWYPGWKAFIDNNETEIKKTELGFRQISIPSGKHKIKFIYDPDSFKNGIKISLITLIFLLGLFPVKQAILDRNAKN